MALFEVIKEYVEAERPFCVATIVAGPDRVGARAVIHPDGSVDGDAATFQAFPQILSDAREQLRLGESRTNEYAGGDATYEIFLDAFVPPPKIVIVGAVQIGQSLCRLAKELGYRVIVTDARGPFVTAERFPEADQLLKGWPQEVLPSIRFDDSTFAVLLSHDPKFDEPTLAYLLPLNIPYIGAIGSRRTQTQRRERLREQGFEERDLEKLHGPVGLDLGGRTAEETALAILAEITAVRHGKAGGMLSAIETASVH